MSLRNIIKANREEIDEHIAKALHVTENPRKNDDEREMWIRNDQSLYSWTRSQGVRL